MNFWKLSVPRESNTSACILRVHGRGRVEYTRLIRRELVMLSTGYQKFLPLRLRSLIHYYRRCLKAKARAGRVLEAKRTKRYASYKQLADDNPLVVTSLARDGVFPDGDRTYTTYLSLGPVWRWVLGIRSAWYTAYALNTVSHRCKPKFTHVHVDDDTCCNHS